MYVLLLAFWILLNARLTLEIFLFGIAIAAAVFFFMCKFMGYSMKKELLLYKSTGYMIRYLVILVREIVIANWNVMKLVYSPKYEPEPGVVYFKTDLKSGLAKVLLANSITLTPGTITLSIEGDQYCIHCLDISFGEGIEESCFVKELRKMEAGWK
ncbi:MAG: Na+/H+ antiporter subunit E [Lachnospiraceae bacterium]|nr:Na+/H+ antiporter subunit E [Lachnospiraceae bacterium]